MTPQLRLQRNQLADLKLIRDLPIEELGTLVTHLEQLRTAPLYPAELRAEFSEVFSKRPEVVQALMRQVLSLYALTGEMGINLDEVFQGLRVGIERSGTDWSTDELQRWQSVEGKLRELLSLDAVLIVAKALHLTYEYSNLLRTARVVTDVRPVFDTDATNMQAAVVSQTLRLRFDNVDGDHSVSLALDENDLKGLKIQCERALLKAATVTERLKKAGIQVMVAGREYERS